MRNTCWLYSLIPHLPSFLLFPSIYHLNSNFIRLLNFFSFCYFEKLNHTILLYVYASKMLLKLQFSHSLWRICLILSQNFPSFHKRLRSGRFIQNIQNQQKSHASSFVRFFFIRRKSQQISTGMKLEKKKEWKIAGNAHFESKQERRRSWVKVRLCCWWNEICEISNKYLRRRLNYW